MSQATQSDHAAFTRPSPNASAPPPVADFEPGSAVRLLSVVSAVLEFRRLIAWSIAASALAFAVLGLVRPRTYTAVTSFLPQSRSAQPNLSGLAAQLGVNIPMGSDAGQSPAFYVELLGTRQILGALNDSAFMVRQGGAARSTSLSEALGIHQSTVAATEELTIRRLRKMIFAVVSPKSGVVTISVVADAPDLAAQIASRLLQLVARFNLVTRQSQAAAERRFTEAAATRKQTELRNAEDRLQAFLDGNRDYARSERLKFLRDRLVREVDVYQQTYASLSQALERAKVDEVRDTPVVTIIEQPTEPLGPDSRGLLTKVALGALLGAFLSLLATIVLWQLRGVPRDDDIYRNFAELRAAVADDLRRPWRLLLGARTRSPTTT